MRLRILENLHLPLWLIKDTCWAMMWRPLGVAMIVPTIMLAYYITWRCRKVMADLLPNLAVSCWITANSIWMADEFFELGIKSFCLVFFGAGIISIAWWLMVYFPGQWRASKG
jgi:hypothetical protein